MNEDYKTKDYSYLEGKEVKYFCCGNTTDRPSFIGIVTGCDYEIGFTIQNKDNLDHYLSCYPGPTGHKTLHKTKHYLYNPEFYDSEFQTAIEMIERGEYRVNKMPKTSSIIGSGPTSSTCTFSQ